MKRALGAVVVALASCASWTPPAPVPADPAPLPPDSKSSPASKNEGPRERFAKLSDELLDRLLADDPSQGRSLGIHAYDGKVGASSRDAIRARIARLHAMRDELASIEVAALDDDQALDRSMLALEIDQQLFQLEDRDAWRKVPFFYGPLFDVSAYVTRDYAPIAERAARLLEHERAALAEVPHVLENLASPMARPVLETSAQIFAGYAEYLRGDVAAMTKGVGSPSFQADFAKTNEALALAATGVAAFLKGELARADDGFALGRERYEKLLRVQEGLSIGLAELKKMGEDDLAKNKAAYLALRKSAKVTKPAASAMLGEAAKLMDAARAFLADKKLVTMPGDDRAIAKETPPFMRWNFAFLDPPGPFEAKGSTAFFYITPPDPSWKKKEQDAYVPGFGALMSTTVHETCPGHFVQNLWIKRAPTRVQRALASYSFVEGWAHYGEQMMVEEGFLASDPQNKLGQLSDALLRDCRFVVSIGLHTEKMTLAQAEKRFVDDCFAEKPTAHQQAVRGTFDPGYFAYTLGKLQILALRDEAKRAQPAAFALGRFHDALLAHGSPPVALVRARVLAALSAK